MKRSGSPEANAAEPPAPSGPVPAKDAPGSSQRPHGYNADNRTDYVHEDGSREAMEAVLRDRRALVKLKGRKRMDAAFRLRAGMVGVLLSCLCDYPLERYETTSGHHDGCPGHRIFKSQHRVDTRRAEQRRAEQESP